MCPLSSVASLSEGSSTSLRLLISSQLSSSPLWGRALDELPISEDFWFTPYSAQSRVLQWNNPLTGTRWQWVGLAKKSQCPGWVFKCSDPIWTQIANYKRESSIRAHRQWLRSLYYDSLVEHSCWLWSNYQFKARCDHLPLNLVLSLECLSHLLEILFPWQQLRITGTIRFISVWYAASYPCCDEENHKNGP